MTVLFLDANDATRPDRVQALQAQEGWKVTAVASVAEARAWLETRPDVDSAKIVYFGESLGSGVAVQLAASQPPAALILRSPYTSLVDLGRLHYPFLPVSLLLRDRYPSIDIIRNLRVPVLIIAGDRDSIIPASNSERLFAAANEPKRLEMIAGADHNDLIDVSRADYWTPVLEFITGLRASG